MYHSIAIGKGVLHLSKILNRSGSTWPGHVALKADRSLIRKVFKKNPGLKLILIAGTNGKTTTTKVLTHILESSNISVLANVAGANLLNGLASLLVKHINLQGTLKHKALLFEVDENSLPLVLEEISTPDAIIFLNLFRDQLDRYGEVNVTSQKWKSAIEKLSAKTLIIGNADDPQIAYISSFSKNKFFYTIDNKFKNEKELAHAVDSTTCPKCNNQLSYERISYSHLGNFACSNCEFKSPKAKQYIFQTKLMGTYNKYNVSSAILAADKVFGINPYTSIETLKNFVPAFGRQEVIEIDNKKIMILLSKNPTGLNESIEVCLTNKSSTILLLLNDRIPDGRDISWIWDVDFEKLKNSNAKIYVSGDRAYDMANRLFFEGIAHEVFEKYEDAYKAAIKNTLSAKTLTILPTYSAMLEVRRLISGKAIL
ncbi:MAG: MurT ligase domain-containing protein [Candidatus Levybacteria bacterium]|nr:MurT ligase domain-containing protein [Candidatus Levybacteria bacterium]